MPNPPPALLTYYPAYCFPLSPTHSTWARLTAAQVHALRERTGFEGTYVLFFQPESMLLTWVCMDSTTCDSLRVAQSD